MVRSKQSLLATLFIDYFHFNILSSSVKEIESKNWGGVVSIGVELSYFGFKSKSSYLYKL